MAKTATITAEQLKKALKLGIKAKDAEGVKKELIKFLAKNDVDDVDGETIDELLEMASAFKEADEAEEEEEESEEESTEEEESEEESTEEEELEEAAEEEEAPVKKTAAPAKKVSTPAPAAKTASKATPTPAKKETKKSADKYTPWDGEDKANKKALAPLTTLFEGSETKWLKQGITVFYPGKSSKKAIISYDRLKVAADGTIVGDLFFNALKGKDEVHQHVGEDKDYKNFNANLLFLSKLTVSEAVEVLEEGDLIQHMNKTLANADKRAVANREKLEEKIAGGKEVAKKVVSKSKAVVEEEEEEEAPVKKTAPAKVVKKAAPVVEEEEEEEEEVVVTKKVVKKK